MNPIQLGQRSSQDVPSSSHHTTYRESFDSDEQHTNPSDDMTTKPSMDGMRKSSSWPGDEIEGIERASTQDEDVENQRDNFEEKVPCTRVVSSEIKRTASNALSKVASRMTTRSIPDPPPPPDGGLKAWTQVAMGWLALFCTWGYTNSFGSFQAYYTETLPVSASTISWIGSVQVFLTFFIGAFSGRMLDAGLFVPTFVVGAILQLLGIFLMSISTQFWHLLLTQGFLTGLGGGIFFCPSIGLLATYFSNKRALAIGLATTGNSVGGIVYPIVVRELLPRIGFAWTTRVLGFINLTGLLVVFAFMRPRLPPRPSGPIIDWKAFREPVYVCCVVGLVFVFWAVYFTYYYLASFGTEELGLPFSSASILVIIINGVGIPARVIPPYFADKIGPLNIMAPTILALAVVAYCWVAVDSVPGLYLFTCFYGILTGTFQCLMPTTIASLTADLNMVGTRLGMAFSCISIFALTGPPIGGAIQAASGGSFFGAQIWAGTTTLIAAILLIAARIWRVGTGWKGKC